MIATRSIRIREGVRQTTQTVDLDHIAFECDVAVTTTFDGVDGAGAPLFDHELEVTVTHVEFRRTPKLAHRYPLDVFPKSIRDMYTAWAGEHIEDCRDEILDRIF
jgi:hypothetical protein